MQLYFCGTFFPAWAFAPSSAPEAAMTQAQPPEEARAFAPVVGDGGAPAPEEEEKEEEEEDNLHSFVLMRLAVKSPPTADLT